MELGEYETISASAFEFGIRITINRPERQNSLNAVMLEELSRVLDAAEQNPEKRFVVLEGRNGIFCSGMDLEAIADSELPAEPGTVGATESAYMNLLKRFSRTPKIIVSDIDGQVIGGGVGLAAASDWVIASPRSRFALSEALWGLLPAMVIPYLIRRVGFGNAYRMTLTTQPIPAEEAYRIHLADEITQTPADSIRKLWLRMRRVGETTVGRIKRYFGKLGAITEQTEEIAIAEISGLMADPTVRNNIAKFVRFRKFPWE